MPALQPLSEPIAIQLTEGDHPVLLETREAGRSETGIRAAVIVKNGQFLYSDDISLVDATQREQFATVAASKAKVPAATIEDGLAQLMDEVEIALRVSKHQSIASGPRLSESQRVMQVLDDLALQLFPTEEGDLFAYFPVHGHWETAPLKGSGRFHDWLAEYVYTQTGKPLTSRAHGEIVPLLQARARAATPVRVFTRVGADGDTIYVDLADAGWRAVAIDQDGWRIVDQPPVRFRRGKAMLPLPIPERGGSLDELRPFINVADETAWRLIIGWVLMLLHPTGPYPQLAVHGERGSGKSGVTRFLAQLVDPQQCQTRAQPREERDIAIAARNCRVLAYDNLSSIPLWLSDAFCRLATGAGFATRELYSDDGEAVFHARIPVIYNGIAELATQGDLLERAVGIMLPSITEEKRRSEREIDAAWGAAHPRLLGALFDAASAALRNRATVTLAKLPRMADFAVWVTAAEPALGWKPGAFMRAYTGNQSESVYLEIEAAIIWRPLRTLLDQQPQWEGSATELLTALTIPAGEIAYRRDWPKAPNKLSGELQKLAPSLRKVGIDVSSSASGGKRGIRFRRVTAEATTLPPSKCRDDR